ALLLACGEVKSTTSDAGNDVDGMGFDAAIQCEPDETFCDPECVDTRTSEAHCGACGAACAPGGECVSSECANPLAAIHTEDVDNGVPRDLFVLRDLTLERTRLNTAAFATGRVRDHAILP